jgi:polyvinyl alcohol dehydrogenase (cytochrome)
MRSSHLRLRLALRGSLYILLASAALSGNSLRAAPTSGEAVYKKYCAGCHDQADSRAPSRSVLRQMSVERITRTLDFGLMMIIAEPLRRDQREAVAAYLGTPGHEPGPAASAFCAGRSIMSSESPGNWNGWSPESTNTRFQTTERAGLTVGQVPGLKLKWVYGFAGDVTAFGAPTVLNGTVFVGSAGGVVQALDAQAGCIFWAFHANGPVRSAPVAVRDGPRTSLLFGDMTGWFYSLDARTGLLLWKRRIDLHEATRLTGTAAAQDGIVYVPAASWEENRSLDPKYICCKFRGSITALRARDGFVVWKTYMAPEPKKTGINKAGAPQYGPSGPGIWSTPTIDFKRGLLYTTTGDNYSLPATATSDAVMALELKTGRIVWTRQTTAGDAWTNACGIEGPNCPDGNGPDSDYGSSAILVHGPSRDILVAQQKSGMIYALDPDQDGEIIWQTRFWDGLHETIQWGMASDDRKIYAAITDTRPATRSSGPALAGFATFDPEKGGGLAALRLEDGEKEWFAPGHPCVPPRPGCSPAQGAALTAIPGVIFSGALDGHVRAFSMEDGKVLWDFDTAKEFTTVNGIPAKGGSLGGAGPVVASGMLFVNSGYPREGGMPGNILLAFGP